MKAFKAYDIRGVYGIDFNSGDVYKIGFFLPRILKTNRILVGRDARTSSPEIFEFLTQGIMDAGADVYNLGLATTPYVYWVTANYHFDGSVQITASHNPKEYNGLKISCTGAMPIGYDSGLNELEKLILQQSIIVPALKKGKMIEFSKQEEYITYLKKFVPHIDDLSVCIDCSNGMASLFIKRLLGEKPEYLFFEMDGTFPNHEANPLEPENVKPLQTAVRKNHYDIGIIFDGDADRVMFVDEKGQFVSPDLIIAVLAHYFEHREKGIVLHDIRTSKSVEEYISRLGFRSSMWRVGRAYAVPRLKQIGGIFGGEFAGHYYFRDFNYSDSGLLACLLVLDVLKNLKMQSFTFSNLIERISVYFSSGEINFRIEEKKQAMDTVMNFFTKNEKPTRFYDFDGYRADFSDWWFNIRPSNTEPYLRFIAEANTKQKLDEIISTTKDLLKPFSNF